MSVYNIQYKILRVSSTLKKVYIDLIIIQNKQVKYVYGNAVICTSLIPALIVPEY
jgi:hypothetical protein